MELTIRNATPDDARAMAEINVAGWKRAFGGLVDAAYLDALSVEDRMGRMQQRLEAEASGQAEEETRVAERDGYVVGFVSFGPSRDDDTNPEQTGEVYGIYVDPAHWGEGVGTALMRTALAELCRRGLDEVILWTLRGNEPAIGFYERHGFAADGGAKKTTTGGGTVWHEVRYRRPPG